MQGIVVIRIVLAIATITTRLIGTSTAKTDRWQNIIVFFLQDKKPETRLIRLSFSNEIKQDTNLTGLCNPWKMYVNLTYRRRSEDVQYIF